MEGSLTSAMEKSFTAKQNCMFLNLESSHLMQKKKKKMLRGKTVQITTFKTSLMYNQHVR